MAAMAAGLQRSTTRTDYSEHSTRLSSTDRHYLLTDIFDVVVSGEPLHVATRNRTATTAGKLFSVVGLLFDCKRKQYYSKHSTCVPTINYFL